MMVLFQCRSETRPPGTRAHISILPTTTLKCHCDSPPTQPSSGSYSSPTGSRKLHPGCAASSSGLLQSCPNRFHTIQLFCPLGHTYVRSHSGASPCASCRARASVRVSGFLRSGSVRTSAHREARSASVQSGCCARRLALWLRPQTPWENKPGLFIFLCPPVFRRSPAPLRYDWLILHKQHFLFFSTRIPTLRTIG